MAEVKSLYADSETGCCPRFDPKSWEGKIVTWKDKVFIKDHITAFLHIPLNFGKVITRMWKKIQDANAVPKEPLSLADDGLWGSDLYIDVSKDNVPGAEMATISGTFMTKVFEGPYKNAGKWTKEMISYVEGKGKKVEKMYYYYTTCPKCSKYYGKNYVVLFARV